MQLVTIISQTKACPLVDGSQNVINVSVSVSPQIPPVIITFTDWDSASDFVSRCQGPDGTQFVQSIMKYLDESR